jgi:type I restriction enzyme, S subunit
VSKWIEGKLKDLVEVNPTVKLRKGEIYPFVSMDVIQPFYKPVEAKEEREFKSGGAKFENGDTLFARITPCLENGKIAQVKNLKNGKGFGSTEFIVLRGKEGITDTDFVYYLVTNKSFRENAERLMVGTSGRQRVDKQQFENQIISIPDLETQKRISSILGSIDKKIELNIEMNKTLEEMIMTLYKHWFVDFGPFQDGEFVESELGIIPENWIPLTFGDLFEIVNDSIDPLQLGEEIPYIGLEHMPKGSISLSEWGMSSQVNSNKNRYKKFDILFGKLRPYFKKVGIAPNDGICSTDIMVFRPKDDIHYGLLLGTVIQNSFIEYCTNASSGTRMPRVNWSEIKKYPIFIPNDNTLIIEFNSKIIKWAKIIIENIQENKYLADLRDYLLPRLLSGEIDLSQAEKQVEEVL